MFNVALLLNVLYFLSQRVGFQKNTLYLISSHTENDVNKGKRSKNLKIL